MSKQTKIWYQLNKPVLNYSNLKKNNNIKMDLEDVGWGGKDWIYLAEDRDSLRALVNMTMNFRVP
jgi:hypothetical protein